MTVFGLFVDFFGGGSEDCGALEVTRGRLRVAEVRLQEYYGETEKARTIERRVEGRLQAHYSTLEVAGALLCLGGCSGERASR